MVTLGIVYAMDMEDGYLANDFQNPMFEGLVSGEDSRMRFRWHWFVVPLVVFLQDCPRECPC